jgi:transcriptional regulator with XRE-family HTH domain
MAAEPTIARPRQSEPAIEQELEAADYPEISDNVYGDWLRNQLDDKKLTAWNLSEKSGVSTPQIYNIIAGRSRNPQKKTRDRLEEALGTKPKGEAKPAEVDLPGMGDLTDFDPHDETLLPDLPGVYVFYDITDRPVYVGKAVKGQRTIRVRVKEHYEKFWFKRPIVDNGAYIEISDETLCKSVEKALIKFLKSNAVLNKQHVEREK